MLAIQRRPALRLPSTVGFYSSLSVLGAASLISFVTGFLLLSGTQARAIGVTKTSDASPLNFRMRESSGKLYYGNYAGDGPYSGNPTDATSPHTFYLSGNLPCEQYTLNFTVMPNQAMQIKEFEYLPCPSDGGSTYPYASTTASTTASASTSASNSSLKSTKKQALSKPVIVGALIGVLVVLALGSLALFIILRRRRNRRRNNNRSFPSLQSPPPPPPSSLMNSLSRSRPWLRLPGPQPKPITPPVTFLTTTFSSSSPAAAAAAAAAAAPVDGSIYSAAGGISRQGYSTTMFNAPAAQNSASASSTSAFPSPAPDTATTATTPGLSSPALPWLLARSAAQYPGDRGYARDAQQRQQRTAAGDAGETTTAAAVEKQPLRPDDDADLEPGGPAFTRGYLPDSKELVEWQRSGAQGHARASRAETETLPRYKARGSFRWSSEPFSPAPFAF